MLIPMAIVCGGIWLLIALLAVIRADRSLPKIPRPLPTEPAALEWFGLMTDGRMILRQGKTLFVIDPDDLYSPFNLTPPAMPIEPVDYNIFRHRLAFCDLRFRPRMR